jgi:hypothetical protein
MAVIRRVERRRRVDNIRKMQERRATDLGEFEGRDPNSDVDRSPEANNPRVKPTLPRVGFLERPDLSKQ